LRLWPVLPNQRQVDCLAGWRLSFGAAHVDDGSRADSVAVTVHGFSGIIGEGVGIIPDPIPVTVGRFSGFGVIAYSVTIAVTGFVGINGEGVGIGPNPLGRPG
jgi:hypothetical protein